jgi:hypothetical protein
VKPDLREVFMRGSSKGGVRRGVGGFRIRPVAFLNCQAK